MYNYSGLILTLVFGIVICLSRFIWLQFNRDKVVEAFSELDKPTLNHRQKFMILMTDVEKLIPASIHRIFNFSVKESQLRLAGWSISIDEFTGLRAFALVIGVAISLVIKFTGSTTPIITLLIPGVMFVFPNALLEKASKRKKEMIREASAEFIESLAVGTCSTATLEGVMQYISEHSVGSPIADELKIVMAHINMGKPTIEALEGMAERLDIEEIDDLVAALKDSHQFGAPLSQRLKSLAKDIQARRRNEILAKAQKADVWITIPIVLLTIPAFLIYLLGPMGLAMARAFGR